MPGGGYHSDTKISGRGGGNLAVVHANGALLTTLIPEAYNFYFHTIYDVPGVVAANNFMTVFNPSGSGKNIVVFSADVASYSTGGASSPNSLTVTRTTASSGGTQISAANVGRFVTTQANPVAEVRVGNPAATTTGLVLFSWPPPISTGAGEGASAYTSVPPGAGFVCAPGQGLVYSTAAGDVDQVWRLNVLWAEV